MRNNRETDMVPAELGIAEIAVDSCPWFGGPQVCVDESGSAPVVCVRFHGCKRHFVATYFTSGKWALVPERRLDISRKPARKIARKEAK